MHHIQACKFIALGTLGLQLLALMVSCSLYYAENKPHYEYRVLPPDFESASQVNPPGPCTCPCSPPVHAPCLPSQIAHSSFVQSSRRAS